jgi:hypothetical protein
MEGIKYLKTNFPEKWAISAIVKTPHGSAMEIVTDMPPALGEELLSKLSWHAGGHDITKWTKTGVPTTKDGVTTVAEKDTSGRRPAFPSVPLLIQTGALDKPAEEPFVMSAAPKPPKPSKARAKRKGS